MTNECTLLVEYSPPVVYDVASVGTGIEKGAILKFADPGTVALAAGDADIVAGIAAKEYIANSGGKISVYKDGEFRGLAGAAISVNDTLITYAGSGATNELAVATAGAVGLKTLGVSLETADDTHTLRFILKPGCNNKAYS